MKYLSLTLIAIFVFSSIAEAGVTARALRGSIKASKKHMTPLLSELDVSDAVTKSKTRLLSERSSDSDIIFVQPSSRLENEALYFKASVSQDIETLGDKVVLSIDIRGINHIARGKLRNTLKDSDWDIIGHFSSMRIKKYAESADSFYAQIEIGTTKGINYDSYRGIKRIVEESLKISLSNGKTSGLRPFLTRQSIAEQSAKSLGAR